MLTVETDVGAVEERLGSGRLACPGCSGLLAGWGHARGRRVRGADGVLWVVPRRSRCTGCRATHVLLPVVLLLRRADTAAVIGAGLTAKAAPNPAGAISLDNGWVSFKNVANATINGQITNITYTTTPCASTTRRTSA